jgi:ABC-type amino acid transport system permease subunit
VKLLIAVLAFALGMSLGIIAAFMAIYRAPPVGRRA